MEVDHGRIEKRTCHVIDDLGWICNKDWKGLKRLIIITAERTNKLSGEQSKEYWYNISSSPLTVNELLNEPGNIRDRKQIALDA